MKYGLGQIVWMKERACHAVIYGMYDSMTYVVHILDDDVFDYVMDEDISFVSEVYVQKVVEDWKRQNQEFIARTANLMLTKDKKARE